MLGDSYGSDYPTWKWRSLQQRRSFIYPILSIFQLFIWCFITSHASHHCEMNQDHSPCTKPYMFFLMGISAFFLTFHLLFSGATVFTQWGIELLSSETMGKRLCILSEISWSMLLFLYAKGVVYWIITDFERGVMISAFSTLGVSLFHHTGLAQRDLLWMVGGIILSWIKLENYNTVSLSSHFLRSSHLYPGPVDLHLDLVHSLQSLHDDDAGLPVSFSPSIYS
jgi:hypothetical protein